MEFLKLIRTKRKRARHRRGHAEARAECRLLRRREEAHRNAADDPAGAGFWPSSTKPTPAWISTRSRSWPKGINALRCPDRSMLVITHYQRLLDYVQPDFVHVLSDGRIVRSGGREPGPPAREGRLWPPSGEQAGGIGTNPMPSSNRSIALPYADHFGAVAASLPGSDLPWLRDLRDRGLRPFPPPGACHRRGSKRWKYTNLHPVAAREFAPAIPAAGESTCCRRRRL